MKYPELLILDLAGTTIEDKGQVLSAFQAILRRHGLRVGPDELHALRGRSKREAIGEIVSRLNPENWAELSEAVYADFQKELILRYEETRINVMPGFDETMEWARGKHIRAIFTTGFDRTTTDVIFRSLGWQPDIATVICGDEVASGRPAPYLIFHAMEAAGIYNTAVIANVGDTMNDLYSASNAGTRWNIGVCSGAHSLEQLQSAPHTHLVANIGLLPSIWE